jgi:hypothetical protein
MGLLDILLGNKKEPCRNGNHNFSDEVQESFSGSKYFECIICHEKRAYECSDGGDECNFQNNVGGGVSCIYCGKSYY